MSHKFIISGGGTGGHIFPAIAIANALMSASPGSEVKFVGALGKMEMEKVPQAGFDIEGIEIQGFDRSNLLRNISLPIKLLKANQKAKKILRDFDPDAVIGTGGYASFPVVHAAQTVGKPTFIQEQNAFAGKSNQQLGKKAKAIFTAFEDMSKFFDPAKTFKYGNPVRKSIYEDLPSREEAINYFDMESTRKTIAVVGGSLGARSINQQMSRHLQKLAQDKIQLVWQTGEAYYETALAQTQVFENVHVVDFIKDIQMLYRCADVIISRAGASAIAELEIMGRPVIFVPFPYAAEDHQRYNAQNLVDHEAASMVLDSELGEHLIEEIYRVLFDERLQEKYSKNIKKLAVYDADDRIAKKILDITNE